MNQEKFLFFSLNPDFSLAKDTAKKLGMDLSPIKTTSFADGEIFCQPSVSVRNKKVFIFQTLCKPVNENLMQLLISIDAFKRAAVKEINVIIPYFAYARQDRKTTGRTPISAKLVSDLITTAGANRLLTVELHSDQIQGFFDIPIDHLVTIYHITEYIKKNIDIKDLIIVAPDFGATKKARKLSTLLNLPLAIIDKKRDEPNKAECIHIFGNVNNKNCLIIDDIIDTGGTIISACKLLKNSGANNIYVCATHGLFNGPAIERFKEAYENSIIQHIYVTDTVEVAKNEFISTISISSLFADILEIYLKNEGSISNLYAKYIKNIENL